MLKNLQKLKGTILHLHAAKLHSFLNSALDKGEWLTLRPARFNTGKEPLYPLNGRVGGLQSWFGRFGEEENLLPIPGFQPRTVGPAVTTPTTPLRMHFRDVKKPSNNRPHYLLNG